MSIFKLPDLGEGLQDAEIVNWLVSVGDTVTVDQPLVALETAKAIVEVPSPFHGKIKQLHGKPGEIIAIGSPLVEFESDAPRDTGTVAGQVTTGNTVVDEPIVMRERGAKNKPGEALRGTRRVMARTMALAHAEVVPVTLCEDAVLSSTRNYSDITVDIIESLIQACQAEPDLNAWYDAKTGKRQLFSEVNLGIAMDSPEGLRVPVISKVNTLSRADIRVALDRLKTAVADKTITLVDMQGASFVLSNFGKFTGRYANPIVVPPTVAILGCGQWRKMPVVKEDKIVIGTILPLSLTVDHRVITGGESARFLKVLIQTLVGDK